ncbi:phage tail assembly protein [Bradyrhizobium sp. USDA 3256]
MTTQTFTLSKPLTTHDGKLTSLTLQEPTAGAFVDFGEPFKVHTRKDANGEPDGVDIEYNNKIMSKWLVEMIAEKVDEISLKGLSARDYYQLRGLATDIVLLGAGDRNPTEPSAA